jgi:hypothetical protein
MGIVLSCIALLITYRLARRSLVYGIVSVLAAGYAFGILRANFPELASYFIFDAAVVGLYAAQISQITQPFHTVDGQRLKHWVVFLMLWPLALFFIPQQDPVVQMVGLRGNMFLLPFILIGARLNKDQIYDVGIWMSLLNLGAFFIGALEYVFGVEPFFPHNAITEIIYRSNDVGSMEAFRIPSVFSNAHTYAGMMVMSLPWIVGAWVQHHRKVWHKNVLLTGVLSAMLGVFMSAVRTHFVVLLVLITVFTFSMRLRPVYRVGWMVILLLVGYVVSTHERMQRFTTLGDTQTVSTRIQSSVNVTLIDAVIQFPFGNGLGGGGTSMPYFLIDRIHMPVSVESELGRIHLETGLIGMFAWVCFILWIFTRPGARRGDPWFLAFRLAWFACLTLVCIGFIGIGLLTSIPCTVAFLMLLGWIATHHTAEANRRVMAFRPGFFDPRLTPARLMPGYQQRVSRT